MMIYIKLTAMEFDMEPEQFKVDGIRRGVINIMSKVTGAIVSKYNMKTRELVFTGHPAK